MIDKVCQLLGVSREQFFSETLPILGVILAVASLVVALFPGVRKGIFGLLLRLRDSLEYPSRKYRRWFLAQHGEIENIYLEKIERLSLFTTFVPLHVQSEGSTSPASKWLLDSQSRRILITGDPGTGKSTLLRATGVAVADRKAHLPQFSSAFGPLPQETPIYIELRHFAGEEFAEHSLEEYICQEPLRLARLRKPEKFLRRQLESGRCLLLLDGLDEVSEKSYAGVRRRIAEFCNGLGDQLPTNKARVVLTCRSQNFLSIRGDWVPKVFGETYDLVPFSDQLVQRFLQHRQEDFDQGRSPEAFFEQIVASGMMDMHRNPLVLTISLGLYLNVPKYEIPSSVAQFYEEMIRSLIQRHDFRLREHVRKKNRFASQDKYRFLRGLAKSMAVREDGFEDFTIEEIRTEFESVCDTMTDVDRKDCDEFIREIRDNAGLISRVSVEDHYVFAHRSIQEYFVAVALARSPDSSQKFLIACHTDPQWRQVLQYYCALDHEGIEPFIVQLRGVNLELAGHCASYARSIPQGVTKSVVEELAQVRPVRASQVSALVGVARSARPPDRTAASLALSKILVEESTDSTVSQLSDLGPDQLAEMVASLSASGNSGSLTVCWSIAQLVSDPEQRIRALWHTLSCGEPDSDIAVRKTIVEELLSWAEKPAHLPALQALPPFSPSFASKAFRRVVYPFDGGHSATSNIVTLLCWSKHLEVVPERANDFLLAMHSGTESWGSVERDQAKKNVSVSTRTLSLVVVAGAACAAVFLGWEEPGSLLAGRKGEAAFGSLILFVFVHSLIQRFIRQREIASDEESEVLKWDVDYDGKVTFWPTAIGYVFVALVAAVCALIAARYASGVGSMLVGLLVVTGATLGAMGVFQAALSALNPTNTRANTVLASVGVIAALGAVTALATIPTMLKALLLLGAAGTITCSFLPSHGRRHGDGLAGTIARVSASLTGPCYLALFVSSSFSIAFARNSGEVDFSSQLSALLGTAIVLRLGGVIVHFITLYASGFSTLGRLLAANLWTVVLFCLGSWSLDRDPINFSMLGGSYMTELVGSRSQVDWMTWLVFTVILVRIAGAVSEIFNLLALKTVFALGLEPKVFRELGNISDEGLLPRTLRSFQALWFFVPVPVAMPAGFGALVALCASTFGFALSVPWCVILGASIATACRLLWVVSHQVYLSRTNPHIAIYSDPRSRLWLG